MSKDNKKEVHLQSDLPDTGEAFAHRRKVIRGMASIPVALTLSSGAAMANASTHACLTGPIPAVPNCDANNKIDGWANSPVKIKPAGTSKPEKYCVAYVEEDSSGKLVGNPYYRYDYQSFGVTKYKYINQDGTDAANIGHPLTASCAASFM